MPDVYNDSPVTPVQRGGSTRIVHPDMTVTPIPLNTGTSSSTGKPVDPWETAFQSALGNAYSGTVNSNWAKSEKITEPTIKTPVNFALRYINNWNPEVGFDINDPDLEQKYGEGQGFWIRGVNRMLKTGATAAVSFAGTMESVANFIVGDDAVTSQLETQGNEWLHNLDSTDLPNFQTYAQRDNPIGSYFNPLNFTSWMDNVGKVTQNLGYTIGAIAAAALVDLPLSIASSVSGGSPIAAAAAEGGMFARQASKIYSAIGKLSRLAASGAEEYNAYRNIINNGENVLSALDKSNKIIKGFNTARFLNGVALSAYGESIVEGNNTYLDIKRELQEKYLDEFGNYIGDDATTSEIERAAAEGGRATVGPNFAFLAISNAVGLGTILRPARAAVQATEKALAREVSMSVNPININTFDIVANKGAKGIFSRMVAPTSIVTGNLREAAEEGFQFTVGETARDFYTRQFDATSNNQTVQMATSLSSSIDDLFGTTAGRESMVMGFLGGAMQGGVKSFINRGRGIKTGAALATHIQSTLQQGGTVTGLFNVARNEAVTANSILSDMNTALRKGDVFEYKNLEHEQLFNFVASGVAANKFDLRVEQLQALKSLSKENFETLFNLDLNQTNKTTVDQYVDAVIEKANLIKKDIEKVNTVYGSNPFSIKKDETNYHAFNTYKGELANAISKQRDYLHRSKQVRDDIFSAIPTASVEKVIALSDEEGIFNTIQELTKKVEELKNSETLSGQNADLVKGFREEREFLEERIDELQNNKEKFNSYGYIKTVNDLYNYYGNGENIIGDSDIDQFTSSEVYSNSLDLHRLRANTDRIKAYYREMTGKEGFKNFQEGFARRLNGFIDRVRIDDKGVMRILTDEDIDKENAPRTDLTVAAPIDEEFVAETLKIATLEEGLEKIDKDDKELIASLIDPENGDEAKGIRDGSIPITDEIREAAKARLEQEFTPAEEAAEEIEEEEEDAEAPKGKKGKTGKGGTKSQKRAEAVKKEMEAQGINVIEEDDSDIKDTIEKDAKAKAEKKESAPKKPSVPAETTLFPRDKKYVPPTPLEKFWSNLLFNLSTYLHRPNSSKANKDGQIDFANNLHGVLISTRDGKEINDKVLSKIRIEASESTTGKSSNEYAPVPYYKDENGTAVKRFFKNIFRSGYDVEAVIYVGDTPIGIMQNPHSLKFKRGSEYFNLDQLADETEYATVTMNRADTFVQFKKDYAAYKASYDKMMAGYDGTVHTVDNATFRKIFTPVISYGSVKWTNKPHLATTVNKLAYRGKGDAIISFPMEYKEMENGKHTYVRAAKPNILNASELSDEQMAEAMAFISDNLENLKAANRRYFYIMRMPDGKFTNQSITFARPDREDSVELENYLALLKEGIDSSNPASIRDLNNTLGEAVYIAHTDDVIKDSKTNARFYIDRKAAADETLLTKGTRSIGLNIYNKKFRVNEKIIFSKEEMDNIANFPQLIALANQKISEVEKGSRAFKKLGFTLRTIDFKKNLSNDATVTLEELGEKLSLAVEQAVFQDGSITMLPNETGVVQTAPVPATPARTTSPATTRGSGINVALQEAALNALNRPPKTNAPAPIEVTTNGVTENVIPEPIEISSTSIPNSEGNLKITDKVKNILDEVSDEKIGEESYQEFNINYPDGAKSFGSIRNGIASITSIDAIKEGDTRNAKRGTRVYERVINTLNNFGIKTIRVTMQSNDSRIALQKLVDKGILINPRDLVGISVDEHPSTFDIAGSSKPTSSPILESPVPAAVVSDVTVDTDISEDGETYNFVVRNKGEQVGTISAYNDGTYLTVMNAEITTPKQGIGTQAYTEIGEQALLGGLQLRSDNPTTRMTDAAKALWNRLAANGVAEIQEDYYVYTGKPAAPVVLPVITPTSSQAPDTMTRRIAEYVEPVAIDKKQETRDGLAQIAEVDKHMRPIPERALDYFGRVGAIQNALRSGTYEELIRSGQLSEEELRNILRSVKWLEEDKAKSDEVADKNVDNIMFRVTDAGARFSVANLQALLAAGTTPQFQRVMTYFLESGKFADEIEAGNITLKEAKALLEATIGMNNNASSIKEGLLKTIDKKGKTQETATKVVAKKAAKEEAKVIEEAKALDIPIPLILEPAPIQAPVDAPRTPAVEPEIPATAKDIIGSKEIKTVSDLINLINRIGLYFRGKTSSGEYRNSDVKEYRDRFKAVLGKYVETIVDPNTSKAIGRVAAFPIQNLLSDEEEIVMEAGTVINENPTKYGYDTVNVLNEKTTLNDNVKADDIYDVYLIAADLSELENSLSSTVTSAASIMGATESLPDTVEDEVRLYIDDVADEYQAEVLRDIDGALRQIAQQLNTGGSDASNTRILFGDRIADIAARVYPQEVVAPQADGVKTADRVETPVQEKTITEGSTVVWKGEIGRVRSIDEDGDITIETLDGDFRGFAKPSAVTVYEEEKDFVEGDSGTTTYRKDIPGVLYERLTPPAKDASQADKDKYNTKVAHRDRLGRVAERMKKFLPFVPIQIGFFENASWKGRIKDGIVQINASRATLDTPIHEMLHPFVLALRTANEELYENLLFDLRGIGMQYFTDVQNDADYAGLTFAEKEDEALVRYLADNISTAFTADGRVDQDNVTTRAFTMPGLMEGVMKNNFTKFYKWLVGVINRIFGVKDTSPTMTGEKRKSNAGRDFDTFDTIDYLQYNKKTNKITAIKLIGGANIEGNTKKGENTETRSFIVPIADVDQLNTRGINQDMINHIEVIAENNEGNKGIISFYKTDFVNLRTSDELTEEEANKQFNVDVSTLPTTFTLEDISNFVIAQESIGIDLFGQQAAIDDMEAYQHNTNKEADEILRKIKKRVEVLSDTAERRIQGDAGLVSTQVKSMKALLRDYDGVEGVAEYVRRGIAGLNMASTMIRHIQEDMKQTNLTEQDVNALNRDLAEVKTLISFYDDVSGLSALFSDEFENDELESFKTAISRAEYRRKAIASISGNLTAEWLYPYIQDAQQSLPEEMRLTREQFERKIRMADRDASTITYWLGAAINSRDPLTAIVAVAIKDKLNAHQTEETEKLNTVRVLFDQFLKRTGTPNNIKAVEQYYKDNFLRKAKVWEVVGYDKEKGEPKEAYVERWAFHEQYYMDLFEDDMRLYKASLRQPATEDEWNAYNGKVTAWFNANHPQFSNNPRYVNPNFTKLTGDDYFQFLYNTYKEGNAKYGERKLLFGIVPQAYKTDGILQNGKEFIKGAPKQLAGLGKKDNYTLDNAIETGSKIGNFFLDADNYQSAQDLNLDGSAYRGVKSPFTHMIDHKQLDKLDLRLNESVYGFYTAANTFSSLRDVQANVENLKMLLEGNAKLGIQARKIGKVDKDGKLLFDRFAGMPSTKEQVDGKINKQLVGFINDVLYGEDEIPASFSILGGKINVDLNKFGRNAGFLTALYNMAGNVFAGVSNITIGNVQSLGEAVGGRYYGKKNWAKAQGIYAQQVGTGKFFADAMNPVKSKVTQLGIIYDAIQGEFRDKYGKNITGNVAARYATTDTFFLINHVAEHQIQLTGMLALMDNTKVKLKDGTEVTLYDAYQKNAKGFYKLREDAQWTDADNTKFIKTLHGISKDLNGNYAAFDKGVIQRHWWGKLALQYRKYLYSAWRSRFAGERFDFERGDLQEGYYKTFFKKFFQDLKDYKLNAIVKMGKRLSSSDNSREAYAARKTMFDVAIMTGAFLIATALQGMETDDDKDKWAKNALLLSALRLRSDISQYSFTLPQQLTQTLKNPSASLNTLTNWGEFMSQLFTNPFEQYSQNSGYHKEGDTKLGAKFEKIVPLYRQWLRLQRPEEAVKYFQLTNKDVDKNRGESDSEEEDE